MTQPLWYVRRKGQTSGPFPSGQLREQFSLGEIDLKDEVSLDGKYWLKLRDTDVLSLPHSHESPPISDEAWRQERQKAKLRWINDGIEVAPGSPEDAAADRLRLHEEQTRSLLDAQSRKRPAFVAGLAMLLILLIIGVGVWRGQSGSLKIETQSGSTVQNCSRAATEGVVWSGCSMDDAKLANAILRNGNLTAIHLERADLSRADLSYANLQSADLRGANLRGAILKGATLSQADLTGADLTGADLGFAVMNGAQIDGVRFDGASLRQTTWVDGHVCGDEAVGECP